MPTQQHPVIPWTQLQTVLLDMDGTLLDLHFDNHFWREYVPQRYAASRGLDIPTAKAVLTPIFRRKEGTLDWYCVDYWSRELNLDIAMLKQDLQEFIAIKAGVPEFLTALRQRRIRTVLVTNAHPKSLALKLERTRLHDGLDNVLSAHEFGLPKEATDFWQRLRTKENFDPASTLLIDDNLAVLRSARRAGIAHLLGVQRPSSQGPDINSTEFDVVTDFATLTLELKHL